MNPTIVLSFFVVLVALYPDASQADTVSMLSEFCTGVTSVGQQINCKFTIPAASSGRALALEEDRDVSVSATQSWSGVSGLMADLLKSMTCSELDSINTECSIISKACAA